MRHPALSASPDHDACGVGFIAQLGGEATRDVVQRALVALDRLSHRGGVDSDGLSGDGAGLLLPIPRVFFRVQSRQSGISLPETFGLGMTFLPPGRETEARRAIESLAQQTGLRCAGWRDVPVNPTILGSLAASTMPSIQQCFFENLDTAADIERKLFFLRKRAEVEGTAGTYFCSLSSRIVVYKGLLTPTQFRDFYLDVTDSDFRTPFAIFHQRYSTNTQPSWAMAQPFRYVAHNGEINTISANRRWMRARERAVQRELETGEWFRALEDRVSDSASFDNALEILRHRGYHVAAAMLKMVPPASESGKHRDSPLNNFLREESFEQEPWDGPAALVFTDGHTVGAKLDRNGLRPMRYCITSDGLVIAGSEAGLTDLQYKEVIERQRLGPGQMFMVDPAVSRCYLQDDFAQFLPARENHRIRRPVGLQTNCATQKHRRKKCRRRVVAHAPCNFFRLGYTAEIAVSEDHFIVAQRVTQNKSDNHALVPMVEEVERRCGARPQRVMADCGFFSNENLQEMEGRDIEAYLPDSNLARELSSGQAAGGVGRMAVSDPSLQRMRQRLRTTEGRAWYKKRKALVEPVIGILKEQRGMRQFQRRGLSAVAVEWALAAMAYNLFHYHVLRRSL